MALHPIEQPREHSPLAAARIARQLTVEEAARRAHLSADEVSWLEDGRVYRFPSADHALLATLLYTTSLGIDHREALALAGLPVPPKPLERNPYLRVGAVLAVAVAVAALTAAVLMAHGRAPANKSDVAAVVLPPAWKINVDVLNGSGDINYTRSLASRVGAYGYTIKHVGRANRFDYLQTAVYYEPGGHDPHRLVVIVGPKSALN